MSEITELAAVLRREADERDRAPEHFDQALTGAMRAAAATITRLVEERDEALAQLHRVTSPDYLAEVLSKVGVVDEARATASEAKVAELQEALKPFAAMASDYDPDEGDDADLAWLEHPKIGWLRAARRALEASK